MNQKYCARKWENLTGGGRGIASTAAAGLGGGVVLGQADVQCGNAAGVELASVESQRLAERRQAAGQL